MNVMQTGYDAVLGSGEKWEEDTVKPAQESLAKFFNIPVDSIRGEPLVGKDLEREWTLGDSGKLAIAKISAFAVRHPILASAVVAIAATFAAAAAGSTTAAGVIAQAGSVASSAGTAIRTGAATVQYYAQGALTGHMANGQTWSAAVVKPFADFIGGHIGVNSRYLMGKYAATFGAEKALYASLGKIATSLIAMPKVLAGLITAITAGTAASIYQYFNPTEVEVEVEVEVPGETVIVEKEVEVPGETVIVEKEVIVKETQIVNRPRADDGRGGRRPGL
jgi:hypothetical protein